MIHKGKLRWWWWRITRIFEHLRFMMGIPKEVLTTTTKTRAALLAFFSFFCFFLLMRTYPSTSLSSSSIDVAMRKKDGVPRIAKVTMLYGGTNVLYERALRTHRWHNEKWNYPFHVLRHEIAGGYWNKPSYLLSLVVNELAKPPGERIEWLMWVDADLILINPSIPLDIFLPPGDFQYVHFVGNRDQNGLNTGTFFLRVHEWSVKMLAKAIAFPMYHPEIDLGNSADQVAMAHIFNETEFGSACLYQPRIWYNAYEWHHGFEGEKGNLLVHFPGLEGDRWRHMNDWLNVVERDHTTWDMSLEKTTYPNETKRYWDSVRHAMEVYREAEWKINEMGGIEKVSLAFLGVISILQGVILHEADDSEALQKASWNMLRQIQESSPLAGTQVVGGK